MEKFVRFNDITGNMLLRDLHIHSTWTDGRATVLQIARRAREMDLALIAITDHIREDSTYFGDCMREIREVALQEGFTILAGFEARVAGFDGRMCVPGNALAEADMRMVSVHRFPIGRKLKAASEFPENICQDLELELSMAALMAGEAHVLGHPAGMSLRQYGRFPKAYFEEIIAGCARSGIAFELNLRYHSTVLGEIVPLLKKYNPLVSLGSDAHGLEEMEAWNMAELRAGGF